MKRCVFRHRTLVSCVLMTSIVGMSDLPAYSGTGRRVEKIKDRELNGAKEEEQKMRELNIMVKAIINKNAPPRIISRRRVLPKKLPLFSKKYDWKEEERVKDAINRLLQDESVELWETFVLNANDPRYCITSYSESSSDAIIYSVGSICGEMAYDRLCNVFAKHLPSLSPHGCPIQLESIQDDLIGWRKDRMDQSLYQLQIVVCEMAIRELPKVDIEILSHTDKNVVQKKIEAEIAELRKTKKPFNGKVDVPRSYPPREAIRIREAFEKASLEDFDSKLNR